MLTSINGEVFELGLKNREKFFAKENIKNYITAGLVHGTRLKRVDLSDNKKIIWKTDGLITNEKNLFLSLTGADCFPVYFFDKKAGAIGIAHAGWRGVVGGIILEMIYKFKEEFSSSPENLEVIIGPGIRICHFEIGEDVLDKFSDYEKFIQSRDGKIFVSLPRIIKEQLLEIGVQAKNIKDSEECTYCLEEKYFSYRREQKKIPDVMVAYIGLTN